MDQRVKVYRREAGNAEGYVVVLEQDGLEVVIQPEWVEAAKMAMGLVTTPSRGYVVDNTPNPGGDEVRLPYTI